MSHLRNELWFSQTIWILEHLESLNVEPNEIIILLLIAHLSDHQQAITSNLLEEKSHLSFDAVDEALSSLQDKGYLQVEIHEGTIRFGLENLFDEKKTSIGKPMNQPVLKAFEEEFGRLFSGSEVERILSMTQKYGEQKMIYALDEAAIYEKRSLNYIENVLISWTGKGLSLEDLQRGKR